MSATITTEFHSLRDKYLTGLHQYVDQLHELQDMADNLRRDIHSLQTLQQLTHKLAGSGETFGFPEVSANARQLENLLLQYQKTGQPDNEERKWINHHLNRLCEAIDTAMQLPQDRQQASPATPPHTGHHKRIFIVDDDVALCALTAFYLRGAGFIVSTFVSPRECLQELQTQPPDIVLMDPGFPTAGEIIGGTPGINATHEIHQLAGKQLPVILLSSHEDKNARLQALRAGSAGYLIKPLNFSALLKNIIVTLELYEQVKRVMIINKDECLANYHASVLRNQGTEVLCLTQPLQSLQRATEFKPDLVILNTHLPGIDGAELAELLHQQKHFSLLPIIFLATDTAAQNVVQTPGVNLVLSQSVSPEVLTGACRNAMHDTQLLKGRIERIIRKTDNRQVTRYYLFAAIDKELQRPRTSSQSAAVYYLGVDHLDKLSSEHGYNGVAKLHDKFCQKMGHLMNEQEQWSAISNLTACVLAPPATIDDHLTRVADIIKGLTHSTCSLVDEEMNCCISGGISLLTPGAGVSDVIQYAETGYETAQAAGGNDARICSPSEQQLAHLTDHLQGDQLPAEHLALSYQPVINIATKDISLYQTILRWRRDDGELISAAKWLSSIDSPQLLIELDHWLLRNAIANEACSTEKATVFVQLSAHTLEQQDFLEFATQLMKTAQLSPRRRIILMVEEGWALAQQEKLESLHNAVRHSPWGLCLTQAGESQEAAHLLGQFRFDYVRLAPSVTSRPLAQKEKLDYLLAIASQNRSQVIATEVEDENALTLLWQCGIHLFQGYFVQTR